jgi:hypothetical protein
VVVDEGLMAKLPLSSTSTSLGEAYCRIFVEFTALPVLLMPCMPWQELELSPPPVTVKFWLESPLSTPCSGDWVTWAMAGTAATTAIANNAANNINFFNLTPPYERVFMTFGILSPTISPVNTKA